MKEKSVFKGKYFNGKFGDIRVILDKEKPETLFCAKDVAKALGFANPSTSVRDICLNTRKEAHMTDGGLQVLNFIGWDDVARLVKHCRIDCAGFVKYLICAEIDMFDKFCCGKSKDDFDKRRKSNDSVADVFDDYCPENCNGCNKYDECHFNEENTCDTYADTHSSNVADKDSEAALIMDELCAFFNYLDVKYKAVVMRNNMIIIFNNGEKRLLSMSKEDDA